MSFFIVGRVESDKIDPPKYPVICGNSIAETALCTEAAPRGFQRVSHLAGLIQLVGPSFYFPIVTPVAAVPSVSGAVDRTGSYGFAGQSTNGIRADMIATWIPALVAAGVVPDILIFTALFENDIAAGRTLLQIQQDTIALMAYAFTQWPNLRVNLWTSRPDERISTASEINVANDLRAWVKTLDDDKKIFVSDISRVNSDGDTWVPNYYYILSTDVTPNRVHPNMLGVWRELRKAAPDMKRLMSSFNAQWTRIPAPEFQMIAPGVAIDAPYTGVKPTGSSVFRSGGNALNSLVGSPLPNGGWNFVINDAAANSNGTTVCNIFVPRMGAVSAATLNLIQRERVAAYARVRIAYGAELIGNIRASLSLTYSGGPAAEAMASTGNTAGVITAGIGAEFFNGDELWIISPEIQPQTATFGGAGVVTAATCDLVVNSRATGNFSIDVLEIGIALFNSQKPGSIIR